MKHYVRGVNWFDRVRWPRIEGAMRDAGLLENSVVVVFSDHGEALLPDSPYVPLRHAGNVLDDALRICLAVRAPGLAPGLSDAPASLMDVPVTVMDCLGHGTGTLGRAGRTDGRSLLEPPGSRAEDARSFVAETWDRGRPLGPPTGDVQLRRAALDADWAPAQACVRIGERKLMWIPQRRVLLGRFGLEPTRRGPGLLRRVLRRTLPGFLRRWLKACWHTVLPQPEQGHTAAPPEPDVARWREAPLFAVDLRKDPLEERPVRVDPQTMDPELRRMLDHLEAYWKDGILGPVIRLSREEDEAVEGRLRELGYVD